ncbi:hypothetical protein D3C83_172180 [compost metagenome]
MPDGEREIGQSRFQLVTRSGSVEAQLGFGMNRTPQRQKLVTARIGDGGPAGELGDLHRLSLEPVLPNLNWT